MNQKSFLLPSDLSETSEIACLELQKLAEPLLGKIVLLAVFEEPLVFPIMGMPAESPVTIDDSVKDEWRERAQGELELLRNKYFQELEVEIVIEMGSLNVAQTILTVAEDKGVDYIAMASHGRSGFKRALLGSVTEQVTRSASCPVIVVPLHS